MEGNLINRFANLKQAGLCPQCGLSREDDSVFCIKCRASKNKANRELCARKKVRSIKYGTCRKCSKPQEANLVVCEWHWIQNMSYSSTGKTSNASRLLEILEKQYRRCYYTGVDLIAGEASIDHLMPVSKFPELRSEISNLAWCHKRINLMKGDMTKDEFLASCRLITGHMDRQNACNSGGQP